MSTQSIAPAPALPQPSPARLLAVIGLALALGYLVVLLAGAWNGNWLFDAQGRPLASDFVNVYAAGWLTGDGHPALAYDWTVHKSMEVRAVGHAFDNYYGWHYPPPFLFAAAIIALAPYTAAALLWLSITLAAYLTAIRAIIGQRSAYLMALGFPATLWNVTAGQNGFLTAALIGGTLTLLERQPLLAGACLGLLSYKPHFGLLFPVALIAGRHWRALGAAAIVTLVMALASWIVFGTGTWLAFFQSTPKMTQAVLADGLADFDRLQSLFGLIRAHPAFLGGGETLAWVMQIGAALGCAAAIAVLWRSRASYPIKAAALATAALIATPYLYIYDLVVLAIPAAYLIQLGLSRGFTRAEILGLPAVAALLLAYPYMTTQVGLAAAIVVAAMILARFARLDRSGAA